MIIVFSLFFSFRILLVAFLHQSANDFSRLVGVRSCSPKGVRICDQNYRVRTHVVSRCWTVSSSWSHKGQWLGWANPLLAIRSAIQAIDSSGLSHLQDRYSSYFNETSKSCHCPFWSYIMQTYLVNDDKFNSCMEKHLLNWEAKNVLVFHEANPAKLTWLWCITPCLCKLATSNRKSLAKMLNLNSFLSGTVVNTS